MKRISALPAACAPLLLVSACIGLMSADPALAQAPASDVIVVNTPTARASQRSQPSQRGTL